VRWGAYTQHKLTFMILDAEKKIKARLAEVDFANVPLDQAIIDATAEVNDRQGYVIS